MITKQEMLTVIKLMTGQEFTMDNLEKLENETPNPTTIEELKAHPFKTHHPFLMRDRPKIVDYIVDSNLDCGYRQSIIDLEEVLEYIDDLKADIEEQIEIGFSSEEEVADMVKDVEDTEKWLIDNKYGSMCLDW